MRFFLFKMGKIRHKWNEDQMKKAIEKVVIREMTVREASERFSVPKSTLGDRVKALQLGKEVKIKPSLGNSTSFPKTFTAEQEEMLYNHVKALDSQLMPLSRNEFLTLAFEFANKLKIKHRFNKTMKKAGKDFYYDFMKRHKDLRLRTAESTSLQRAAGFNKEQVGRFFSKLNEMMEKFKFSPAKIYNADETGVTCVHNNKLKVMSMRGKKQVGKLTSAERGKNVTLLLSINASGDLFIPPLFVFPRVRLDEELKKDAPLGSIFDAQPSGWITVEGFLKWLKVFTERVNPTETSPALLIIDGHASHKDLNVITFAKENHIHMLSLPPHTSHRLQPLDRTVMKPFKNAYNEACSMWMRKYPNIKIALKDIAGLVNTAFSKICRMEIAQSGFKCTGIHPLNPNIFSDLDYAPSLNKIEDRPISQNVTSPNFNEEETDAPTQVALDHPPFKDILALPGPSTSTSTILVMPSLSALVPNDEETTVINNLTPTELSGDKEAKDILEKISPLPSTSSTKFATRQGRGEKSEILTSTPYKSQLEQRMKEKEEKKIIAEAKKKIREENRMIKDAKRKLKFANNSEPKIKKSRKSARKQKQKKESPLKVEEKSPQSNQGQLDEVKDVGEGINCIICNENFQEDWIQCNICEGWAHENCADLEGGSPYYKCDICVALKL